MRVLEQRDQNRTALHANLRCGYRAALAACKCRDAFAVGLTQLGLDKSWHAIELIGRVCALQGPEPAMWVGLSVPPSSPDQNRTRRWQRDQVMLIDIEVSGLESKDAISWGFKR